MKKRLFIRFFSHTDGIPDDSWPIYDGRDPDEASMAIKENALEIASWMVAHPEGKVDVVWLS